MTKSLSFSVTIGVSREVVWQVLFDDESYRRWSSGFAEGSHVKGDWSEGSTLRFLTPSGDGMVSVVGERRPHEYMSVKHIGVVNEGVDDTESDEVKAWAPSYETYALRDVAAGTALTVNMEAPDQYEGYFEEAWPRVMEAIKSLAEEAAG